MSDHYQNKIKYDENKCYLLFSDLKIPYLTNKLKPPFDIIVN